MPIPIILPKFGFTLETADIVQWLKHDGDSVRAGDPICEVTTDKVNMEVEAPESGTLIGQRFEAGATVPVTEIIAYLLRPGEARPSELPNKDMVDVPSPAPISELTATVERKVTATQISTISPVAQRIAEASNIDLTQVKGTGPNNRIIRRDIETVLAHPSGKVRATPAARLLAEQSSVDLQGVSGSGPRGRIQAADVQVAIETAAHPIPVVEPPTIPIIVQTTNSDAPRIVKLEGMRKTIATRLQKSFQTAPHIFFDAQIDTSGIDGLRQKLNLTPLPS